MTIAYHPDPTMLIRLTPNEPVASMSLMEEMNMTQDSKKEWVAVLHGQNGTVKIAYRSPEALARGLAEQTAGGWMAAHVYERDRQTNADE